MALPYLELLLKRLRFRARMVWFALTVHPVAGGAPDKDDDSDDDQDDEDDSDDDKDDEDSDDDKDKSDEDEDQDDDEDEDEHKKPSFLRRAARKHERAAKREKRRADRLQAEVDRLKKNGGKSGKKGDDAADKGDDEVTQAKKDLEAERREFRLEQAVTKIARKGVTVGEGKKSKTVKFEDPDDALAHLERQIEKGDLDAEDIFDSDGKPKPASVQEALQELLEEKPHLIAGGARSRPKGGAADTRKGDKPKDLEAMTPEDHARRKYGDNK